jgi:SAM-dependent methyltransferase
MHEAGEEGERPDEGLFDAQCEHWDGAFESRPDRFGTEPSAAARGAAALFRAEGRRDLLELGAGQGRDTLFFARSGFRVLALDYSEAGVAGLAGNAAAAGLQDAVTVLRHDVREPLPAADGSADACYSHMLYCMALTTPQLEALTAEVGRVLRPGGLLVYTARHTGDPDAGAGAAHGDDMFEAGGFIVHFFDRDLVERLARGFELLEVAEFEEGQLPRRLYRVTMRKPG